MFCANCGEHNENSSKFCSNCGHSLVNEQTGNPQSVESFQSQDEQSLNPDYVNSDANNFQQPGYQQFKTPSSQRATQQQSKKMLKVWIISSLAALIIVILAVSYGLINHFYVQNSANPDDNNIGLVDKENNDDIDEKETKEEKVTEVIEEKEKTQIIKESLPNVFTIITQDGHGSGFLYADGGYIVTNAHVVAGFSDVLVRNSAGQESPGKVIGISDTLDIALVFCEEYEDTEPLPLGKETPDLGSEVIAIGSPQGFENSASIGYLTGIGREMPLEGYNFVYEELYQIDAQIDQGSSGGPLFDAKTGEVIGINSLIYSNYQEFAFAIPLYTVSDYFDDWIDNPMSASEVAAVDIYVGYDTDTEDLGEDYSKFWEWYEQYYGEGTDEYVDYDNYLNTFGYYFDEETLTSFINSYFEYYEWSINDGDFYWVQDLISPESNAYLELERQIEDYYGYDTTFDYRYTEITGIDIYEEEGYAVVTTNEEYDLYNEAGEFTSYSETAEYYVIINENGYYLISEMYYYEAP